MTPKEVIDTLKAAAVDNKDNLPLRFLLQVAAETIEELDYIVESLSK